MSQAHNSPDHQPTPEEIAMCAYLIWVEEGRPDGRANDHWYQAEIQLHAAHAHNGWTGRTDREAHHSMSE